MGAALGREARSGGAQLLEVPDVNLKRGPLSGRSADTWAEDPCLTGALAAAFLQGVQSAGVGGCAGRLAVVNQETDRRTLNRRVDERTLQELYLPAFETAVRDGQPRAVVCSAGQLNGTRICEDTALLTVRCWQSRARCRTRPGRWPRAWTLPLRTRGGLWMPCSPAHWTSPF